jgi:hypothetical protein
VTTTILKAGLRNGHDVWVNVEAIRSIAAPFDNEPETIIAFDHGYVVVDGLVAQVLAQLQLSAASRREL